MVELTSLLQICDLFFNPDGVSIGEWFRVSDQSINNRLVSVKYHDHATKQQTVAIWSVSKFIIAPCTKLNEGIAMSEDQSLTEIAEKLIGDRTTGLSYSKLVV